MAAPSPTLPEPPAQLKAIHSFLRMAQDVDRVDTVVGYWLRLFSTENALKIDKDSPECKSFLVSLLSWLESFKKSHLDNEAVTNQTVGQAHYENFVMALFNKADSLDRAGTANKNTVRMFFMASVLFEAMAVFGPLTDEVTQRAKYAKFKAAYIQKCLKTGQTPKPGPIEGSDLEGGNTDSSAAADNSSQPPVSATLDPHLPRMPTTIGPSDSPQASTPSASSGSSLYIPEVPKDPTDESTPAAAINPPRPTDPFILTPSDKPRPSPTMPSSAMPQQSLTGSSIADARLAASNGVPLHPEDIIKSQRYCKFANSALQYDDIPTAVANLQKALKLLTTGENPD